MLSGSADGGQEEMNMTQGWTRQTWNNREWTLRFDEIRPYLASKDTARVGLLAKARPDAALIAAAIAQGKVRRIPKGMRSIH